MAVLDEAFEIADKEFAILRLVSLGQLVLQLQEGLENPGCTRRTLSEALGLATTNPEKFVSQVEALFRLLRRPSSTAATQSCRLVSTSRAGKEGYLEKIE